MPRTETIEKTLCEAASDFHAADVKYHNALVAEFGKRAGDMRYTEAGRGVAFSALRIAWKERDAARAAWDVARAQKAS